MLKFFAGIGSRQTPSNILPMMAAISKHCMEKRFYLRSGGAKGADTAFEEGVPKGDPKEIFTAYEATNDAINYVRKYYNAQSFEGKPRYVQRLLGRNAMIILGKNLDTPSKFVVCWTPGAKPVGGTGLGLKIAEEHKISVYNLADLKVYTKMRNALGLSI